jgi:hypothetical protein
MANMSAKSGLAGAILLPDGPFWYHWQLDKGSLATSLMMVATLPTTLGNCNDAMTCAIVFAHIGIVQRSTSSAAFFLPVVCTLRDGGDRRRWHCSQCIIRCGRRHGRSCGLLPLLLCPYGSGRHGIHGGEGRGHNDDLNLVANSFCNVRRRRQQDTKSCGGSGDRGGGGGLTFGIGKVGCQPLHGLVGLSDLVSEEDGALGVIPGWNRLKGAVLSKDCDPLQLNPVCSVVGGHLKVDRQLSDIILPTRHVPVEDIHNCA